ARLVDALRAAGPGDALGRRQREDRLTRGDARISPERLSLLRHARRPIGLEPGAVVGARRACRARVVADALMAGRAREAAAAAGLLLATAALCGLLAVRF